MTVGSHEFYLGYAIRNQIVLCLDMGHFHPTENIADKLSAVALSVDELLLHVSRPMRWDSDHVILLNDDILARWRRNWCSPICSGAPISGSTSSMPRSAGPPPG